MAFSNESRGNGNGIIRNPKSMAESLAKEIKVVCRGKEQGKEVPDTRVRELLVLAEKMILNSEIKSYMNIVGGNGEKCSVKDLCNLAIDNGYDDAIKEKAVELLNLTKR